MDSSASKFSHPLDVKKSSVRRTLNDYEVYKDELCAAQSKYDSIKDKGDKHEVRRAKDSLDESIAVLEHTKKRLYQYAYDLDQYIRDSLLPMLKDGNAPPRCRTYVNESKKFLDQIITKHPEIGFSFPKKE